VAKAVASDGFCDAGSSADPRGSSMFDGFQLAIGGDATCLLLLFQPWVLSSGVKYAFGFLGVVLLGMAVEGMGDLRDAAESRFYRDYGIVFSQADYTSLATPMHSGDSRGSASFSDGSALPRASSKLAMVRRIPLWCKLALAASYAVHMALAYLAMLVIMSYETLMFVAVVLGLGLGFVLFKDTEADVMGGNVDPCCST
jgi:copper transporter 1